ncbi:MAG TPA: ATP-binding protein [Verrucomicrobiae bacterium]|nr:ATP-binding protein [Verrucomicrobiae bacterium]
MAEFFKRIFSPNDFMPHGHCYLWTASLVWLHVIADMLIGLAYLTIPLTLVYFIRKRRDIPFNWMFFAFGVFILACGMTHFMEVWNIWHAAYWLAGAVKMLTAVASILTAILLVKLIPVALTIPSPAQLAAANDQLKREIAERAEAERKVTKLNDELQRHNTDLETTTRELEAFSYSISHDLRAPLRGLSGFSQVLLEDYHDKLGDEGKDLLQRIRAGSQRMGQLIDDLLNLSRVSRSELRHEPVDLSRLAGDIAVELRARDPQRDVELRIDGNLTANGDPQLLRVVLENLLGNAWKYTAKRPHATIEVGFDRDNGHSSFFVRDDGVGFDMKYVHKLFAPFQRLHGMTEFPGSGVGLATVQRIIHRHGGRVWALAEVDKGATFHFTLS